MVRRLPIFSFALLLSCLVYSGVQSSTAVSKSELITVLDQSDNLQIKVYPNPFSDKVMISSNLTIDSYRIYNILGAQVREGSSQLNQLELDTSDLSSGIYMLEVQSGNRRMTVKLVRR